MAEVSITDAARLAGVSEKTIRRKIAAGELSAQLSEHAGQARKVIDTSELIRVFGSLPGQVSAPVPGQSPVTSTHAPDVSTHDVHPLAQVIEAQKVTIRTLETQLDARTQEARELRAQVGGLLEYRRPDSPAPVAAPAVTRRDVVVVVLIAAVAACAWAWTAGYRLWFII